MPSRASLGLEEPLRERLHRAGPVRERRPRRRRGQRLGLGQSLRRAEPQHRGQAGQLPRQVGHGAGDQTGLGGGPGVEALAGEEVACRGPLGHPAQGDQRDHRRGEPQAHLGEREAGGRAGQRDVARAHQPHAAGPHVPVDGGDDRLGQLDQPAEQGEHAAGALGRPALRGLLPEVGPGAERLAGVREHHGPDRGVRTGGGQVLAERPDQRGGERVAVLRAVQGQRGDAAVDGVVNGHPGQLPWVGG